MRYELSTIQKAKLLVTLFEAFDIPLDEEKQNSKEYALARRFEILTEASSVLSLTSLAIAEALNNEYWDIQNGDLMDGGLNAFDIQRETGFDLEAIKTGLIVAGFMPRNEKGDYQRSAGASILKAQGEVFADIPGYQPAKKQVRPHRLNAA